MLPLGSETLRELTPLVRSVLLAGPRGSGKRMLVEAVCTELGATLFDITPANIAGKYPGKSGLVMLLHLVSKVRPVTRPLGIPVQRVLSRRGVWTTVARAFYAFSRTWRIALIGDAVPDARAAFFLENR